jgi:hypothetical protein
MYQVFFDVHVDNGMYELALRHNRQTNGSTYEEETFVTTSLTLNFQAISAYAHFLGSENSGSIAYTVRGKISEKQIKSLEQCLNKVKRKSLHGGTPNESRIHPKRAG